MSEIYKTDGVIEYRKRMIKTQGYWVCPKCAVKYYAGINCDPCMADEFTREMKTLLSKNRCRMA